MKRPKLSETHFGKVSKRSERVSKTYENSFPGIRRNYLFPVLLERRVIRVITLITLLCCFDDEGHSLCWKKGIPCVRRGTFFVFEEGHSLCSKEDIPCVPSRTFPVFQPGHVLCSKQEKNVLAPNVLIIPLEIC